MALIDESSKKIVPFDAATYRPMRRTKPLFKPPRPRPPSDKYSREMAEYRPVQVDPYSFPTGGLGDLSGATGIPAIDGVIESTQAQIAQAKRALQITAIASSVAALCGLILVTRR